MIENTNIKSEKAISLAIELIDECVKKTGLTREEIISYLNSLNKKPSDNIDSNESKYIDDLSYSNLVNIIQGNIEEASNVVDSIALEMKEKKEMIDKIEKDLNQLRRRMDSLIGASHKILKYLKRETPLFIQRDGYVIILTEDSIVIQDNVI